MGKWDWNKFYKKYLFSMVFMWMLSGKQRANHASLSMQREVPSPMALFHYNNTVTVRELSHKKYWSLA